MIYEDCQGLGARNIQSLQKGRLYIYRIISEGSINLNTHFLASQPARLFLILSSSLKSFCSWWSTIPCLLANRRHFWRYTLGSATRDHWCCQAPWFQQFHLRWQRSSSPTRHGDKAMWHGNTKGSFWPHTLLTATHSLRSCLFAKTSVGIPFVQQANDMTQRLIKPFV